MSQAKQPVTVKQANKVEAKLPVQTQQAPELVAVWGQSPVVTRRALSDPRSLNVAKITYLQRTIGNQALDQIVRPYIKQSATSRGTSNVQCKCACGRSITSGDECTECQQKRLSTQNKIVYQPDSVRLRDSNRQARNLYTINTLKPTYPSLLQRVGPTDTAAGAIGLVIGAVTFLAASNYAKSLSTRYPGWLNVLPNCPCTKAEISANRGAWERDKNPALFYFHPGAATSFRSKSTFSSISGTSHGQQCTYDAHGALITEGPGAGTPDVWSPNTNQGKHFLSDVATWQVLGWRIYNQYWKPNNGNGCPACRGDNTLSRRISEFLP